MDRIGESLVYAFEGFELDARRRILSRADGEPIPLPPKAFDALLYLVEHPGELLDKGRLMDAIWPNVVVEENNLNQAISTLRRLLGELPGEQRFIRTEPGRGYRFVASVARVEAPPPANSGRAVRDGPRRDQAASPAVLSRRPTAAAYLVSAITGALLVLIAQSF
jgi:DNA-binding winged helix-turn-helix (wHTH) protein